MFHRTFNAVNRRFLFTSSTQFVRKSKEKSTSKKSVPSLKKNIAFPPAFDNKLISWPSLIGAEIEADLKSKDDVYIDTIATNLTFSSYTIDPIEGHIVELAFKDGGASTERVTRGMPVKIIQNGENVNYYETVVIEHSAKQHFRLKLRKAKLFDPQVAAQCTYSIAPSEDFGSLHVLQDFLRDRNGWSKMPGYPILQCVYRATPMKIVYADRRLSYYHDLNESQQEAVNAAMNKQRPIVCIQGPPGTGKTHVLTEIILQANKAKQNVLICAASHQAINNLISRIDKSISNVHNVTNHDDSPKTLADAIKNHSQFDLLVERYSELLAAKNKTMDVEQLQKIGKVAERLNNRIKREILKNARIIFSTLSSSSVKRLRSLGFIPDLVIVEEAAQATECATWMALFQAPRAVIAGDDCQLGPTIMSEIALNEGLGQSLMSVIRQEHGSKATILLKEQYRMNESIQKWSSDSFYESKLQPHESVKDIKLSDISENFKTDVYSPMVFVDTKGVENAWEKSVLQSYYNHYEALIVVSHLKNLLKGGLSTKQIGIITPYSSQVNLIKQLLGKDYDPALTVSSVDAFQGEQRDAIIMSLVRSNSYGNIGFLSDLRRMNVSITRAKRHLCLIGNSTMLETNRDLSALLSIFKNYGIIISSMDYSKLCKIKSFRRFVKMK